MSKVRLTWQKVQRFFRRRGFDIRSKGGDKFIVAPKGWQSTGKPVVRIGHKCCRHAHDIVYPAYISKLERTFNVTAAEILAD